MSRSLFVSSCPYALLSRITGATQNQKLEYWRGGRDHFWSSDGHDGHGSPSASDSPRCVEQAPASVADFEPGPRAGTDLCASDRIHTGLCALFIHGAFSFCLPRCCICTKC